MRITPVTAHNWRNAKNLDFDLGNPLIVVGPDAAAHNAPSLRRAVAALPTLPKETPA